MLAGSAILDMCRTVAGISQFRLVILLLDRHHVLVSALHHGMILPFGLIPGDM